MALEKSKPTSPGQRFVIKVTNKALHKGQPYAPLVNIKTKTGGRNNAGRITCRHIGGGHKQRYRAIDFKRDKDSVPARIERLEYDPNRSAYIALALYADGERRYVVAANGLKEGDEIVSGSEAAIKVGNCLPLTNIPIGSTLHCLELK